MNLHDYFENTQGLGVLATADSDGKVDLAVYARPHVTDENTVAFIMAEHLTHQNLESNPHAAYLFVEKGPGYLGKRLYLTRLREETDRSLIESFRRRTPKICAAETLKEYLVYFRIDNIRPLVGGQADQ
ncbi:MAG TPA: pyridoxamine 5'-phosphate oxidase family protein [Sedimentisphaerales bacterium]|nr:pyridoxamine 5'-phosphate oxidase family protein [Sedimentisphaerales bacterium]